MVKVVGTARGVRLMLYPLMRQAVSAITSQALLCFWWVPKWSSRFYEKYEKTALQGVIIWIQGDSICGHFQDISRAPMSEKDSEILSLISYLGCGISSIFLGITLMTYLAFGWVHYTANNSQAIGVQIIHFNHCDSPCWLWSHGVMDPLRPCRPSLCSSQGPDVRLTKMWRRSWAVEVTQPQGLWLVCSLKPDAEP